MKIVKKMNNSLKIALVSLALIIFSMLPAFIGFIPKYKLHLVTVFLRIGLVYIALLVPLVFAVRQFLLNCYDSSPLKKYIILSLGFFSLSYLAIFTDALAFSYKVIALEQKKFTALIDLVNELPNSALNTYQGVIDEQEELGNSYKKKEAFLMLAAPLIKFCFMNLCREVEQKLEKSSGGRFRLLDENDGECETLTSTKPASTGAWEFID